MSSSGGLESVFDSINSAPSANGGSNPAWVWYIDRSEVETLCRNSLNLTTSVPKSVPHLVVDNHCYFSIKY